MATEDVKKFLFQQTGIAESNWKRLSKYKAKDGSEVRAFQDKVSGRAVETIEDKNGHISFTDSVFGQTKPKGKVIGYYQFDAEQFSVALVTKEFWETNGYLCDSGSEEEFVPDGFYALTDAIYEHDLNSHEDACAALEKAGFVEKKLFEE